MEFKDYSDLIKKNEYDKKRAELFGEAITEKKALEKRIEYLNQIVVDNNDLVPFMWTTLDGLCKPLHLIDDDHLRNIINYLIGRGVSVPQEIKSEAMSRNITIENWEKVAAKRLNAAREAEVIDEFGLGYGYDD